MKRIFVIVFALTLASVLVYASGKKAEEEEAAAPTGGLYGEAPMLAKMVAQGELPPVDKRLPDQPVVVEPYQGNIGKYGGTLITAHHFGPHPFSETNNFVYERLVRFEPEFGPNMTYQYSPDIADWYEVSDDGKMYTFHIRDGVKWSDGEPYTTEDVRFYWEDVMNNDEIRPIVGVRQYDAELEIIDDLTFKLHFQEPNFLFIFDQAAGNTTIEPGWTFYPAHYMKQFHPEYASASDLAAKAKEMNFDNWELLFDNRRQWHINPEIPVFAAWQLEREPTDTKLGIYKRNPYYRKVDTEGNQLPYIDYFNTQYGMDIDTMMMKLIQGELDFVSMSLRLAQYPLLKQNEATAPYSVGPEVNTKQAEVCVYLNYATEDPVMRDIFRDIRFRKAISHSINRQEIIDTVFHGAAEPSGLAVGPYVSFYRPEWKTMYTEYDPDLANELLDEMGLKWDSAREYRLRPDGQTLEIRFIPGYRAGYEDMFQLFMEYWEDVGIKSNYKLIKDSATRNEITDTAECEVTTGSVNFNIADYQDFQPTYGGNTGQDWSEYWSSRGESGEEPIDFIKDAWEHAWAGIEAPTIEDRKFHFGEALDIWVRNLCIIGVMGHDARPSAVHDRLKNYSFEMENMNLKVGGYPVLVRAPEQWWLDPDWKR